MSDPNPLPPQEVLRVSYPHSAEFQEAAEPKAVVDHEPVAVLVCHGMGQQVRYETISSIAQAIRQQAADDGGIVQDVDVELIAAGETIVSRAMLQWKKDHRTHEVHVYEAYWAPLTEGKVTYWDTVKFLLQAAANGLSRSEPFTKKTFKRWMFKRQEEVDVGEGTFEGIFAVLAFVLFQVLVIAYAGSVAIKIAAHFKMVSELPFPMDTAHWLSLLAMFFKTTPLEPAGHAIWRWVFWLGCVIEAAGARYFLVQYVGDVAAYISPYKSSKFDQIRRDIQAIGFNVGKIVYGFQAGPTADKPYKKVVIVGHSLGSVLAYDTLNWLINWDAVCEPGVRRHVAERTRALITFGSPLDKTAFIFRMQTTKPEHWIRELMATAMQPLIVNYQMFRKSTFEWVNIWSPMDIISGSLDYYDTKRHLAGRNAVKNLKDPQATTPLKAHIQYWDNDLLHKELLYAVTTDKPAATPPSWRPAR